MKLMLLLAPLACATSEEICTTEARAGLNILVVSAASRARICDATVVARGGSEPEILQATPGAECSYAGAWERAGTYDVEVSRSGFVTQTLTGIVVGEDGCHVIGESRTVELQPQ